MLVTTTQFRTLAEEVAATLGLAEARLLTVEHPLGGTSEATIAAWADGAVEEALRLFTAP